MAKSSESVARRGRDQNGQAVCLGRHRADLKPRILLSVLGFALGMLGMNDASASPSDGVHTLTIEERTPGNPQCKYEGSKGPLTGKMVRLDFQDTRPASAHAQGEVEVRWTDGTKQGPEALGRLVHEIDRPPRNFGAEVLGTVWVIIGGKEVQCSENPLVLFSAVWSPLLDKDAAAFQWWLERLAEDKKNTGKFAELKKRIRPTRKHPKLEHRRPREIKHYLVHLPSGAVAPPYPSDITESDRTQVVVIIPTNYVVVATLDVKQCEIPQTFRAEFDEAPDAATLAQLRRDEDEFALQTVGPILRCGPASLEYDLNMKLKVPDDIARSAGFTPDERITVKRLRVNPKYHIAAVVAVGWDFAKETQYFKQQLDPGDPDAEPPVLPSSTIESREVSRGVILYIGAQWMIGGVDYHNMKWWNYFGNLFVAVNAASPLDDFALGITVTPTGGISLAVGPTFHKRTYLADGIDEAQPFVGDGDIPTTRRWEKPVVGAFLGLTIDSNIFRALKAVKYD